jgi:two-component system cell cycle sensor histidine kinase/response regulator CckA
MVSSGIASGKGQEPSAVLAHTTARLLLARLSVHAGTTFASVCARVTELSARSLGVERVGLWLFERGASSLRCVDQFTLSTGLHTVEGEIDAKSIPVYVAALEAHREIVAPDARRDPRTQELTQSYLTPKGITSMLDAPVFRDGDVVGVLCHEQVGRAREWSVADIGLAATGADVIAIAFEQTARLHAEKSLHESGVRALHAQKLEALGLVAAKVAHDFNNVLTIVQGSADILALRTDAGDGLDDIRSALRLGRDLVKNLLAFVRPTQTTEAPMIDLGVVVAALVPAARRLAAGRIVIVDIARGEWRARLDSTDVERIVSNLVVNARNATTEGGEITLRVRGDSTETPPSVILEVSDNGTGMDAATQSRMFDPFFTTRADAGGTGLGLSTVHGIVHATRGAVDVESEVGRGTTIRIRLPAAA